MDSREKASAGTSGVGKGSQGILRVDASKSHRIAVQVSTKYTIPILYCSSYLSCTRFKVQYSLGDIQFSRNTAMVSCSLNVKVSDFSRKDIYD